MFGRWFRRRRGDVSAASPELDQLLAAALRAAAPTERIEWLRSALRWIEQDIDDVADSDGIARAHTRVRFLLQVADRDSDGGRAVRATLAGLVDDLDLEQMTAVGAIPRRAGFMTELYERCLALLLPQPDFRQEPALMIGRLLGKERTIAWIDLLPGEDARRLARLFAGSSPGQTQAQLGAAMLTLASEAQAVGLASEMRRRFADSSALDSPFGRLVAAVEAFLAARDETARSELDHTVDESLALLATVHARHVETGVSVDLFYRTDRTRAQLGRVQALARWLSGEDPLQILREVVNAVRRDRGMRGVRALVRENMRLLSRRIAERNAETGSHYIAGTRAQYRHMLAISAGGGALMAIAVYLKFAITAAHMPPFWEGFFASLNYAGVFVLIALAHFTVATKQPAMTAPALAARMRELDRPGEIERLVAASAALVRSQFASVFGNLFAVVPAVLAVAALWWLATGHGPLEAAKARSVLQSQSVLGPSFLFAAYTGVLLWLSGLFAGWADNAFTVRQLHAALATNAQRVRRHGIEGARVRADWWRDNIAGLAGNIGLGVLLGLTPILWAFFGVPMEVRHVTLSTGQVAVAAFSLGIETLTTRAFWLAIAGLAVIGILNVGVSFGLALRVAMRAVDISAADRLRVYRAIRQRLLARPGEFVWPPAETASAAAPGAATG
ncbi:MAG: site-specific recombinase [Burkholderiaceae bacterium]|nr:site-specific recombinase [Burkholderiaceae bacterium]